MPTSSAPALHFPGAAGTVTGSRTLAEAGGARGADLAAACRVPRMLGRDVSIRARVVQLAGLSARADGDGSLGWLRATPAAPGRVCADQGEAGAADRLRARIQHGLGWRARVPLLGDAVDVGASAPPAARAPAEVAA